MAGTLFAMKLSKVVVLALIAGIALSGCSTPAKAIAAPPSPLPTPSPTLATDTILQYASEMNGPIKSFQKAWNDYEQKCLVGGDDLACALGILDINATASTISISIDIVESSKTDGYVGPAPAELAPLVANTKTDADKVAADTKAMDPKKLSDGWTFDVSALTRDLDQWGPYLNA